MDNTSGILDEQAHHEDVMREVCAVLTQYSPFVLKNGHSDEELRSIACSIVANRLLEAHAVLNVYQTAPDGVYSKGELAFAQADAMRLFKLQRFIGE